MKAFAALGTLVPVFAQHEQEEAKPEEKQQEEHAKQQKNKQQEEHAEQKALRSMSRYEALFSTRSGEVAFTVPADPGLKEAASLPARTLARRAISSQSEHKQVNESPSVISKGEEDGYPGNRNSGTNCNANRRANEPKRACFSGSRCG